MSNFSSNYLQKNQIISGDIITHINDYPIHGSSDVYKHLEGDKELSMIVVRRNQVLKVKVRPEDPDPSL